MIRPNDNGLLPPVNQMSKLYVIWNVVRLMSGKKHSTQHFSINTKYSDL